jgi:hypothetical protein
MVIETSESINSKADDFGWLSILAELVQIRQNDILSNSSSAAEGSARGDARHRSRRCRQQSYDLTESSRAGELDRLAAGDRFGATGDIDSWRPPIQHPSVHSIRIQSRVFGWHRSSTRSTGRFSTPSLGRRHGLISIGLTFPSGSEEELHLAIGNRAFCKVPNRFHLGIGIGRLPIQASLT